MNSKNEEGSGLDLDLLTRLSPTNRVFHIQGEVGLVGKK